MKQVAFFFMLSIVVMKPLWADVCHNTGDITQFGGFELCASSALSSQNGIAYGPSKVFDGDESTAWVEGVSGSGEGQWLRLRFDGEMAFQSLFVTNGYNKSQKAFQNNGRVREVRIQTADNFDKKFSLPDKIGSQEIRLPRKVNSSWVKITIVSVYPGAKWKDTAISEFQVDLEEHNYEFSEAVTTGVGQQEPGHFLTEEEALDQIMYAEEIKQWAIAVGRADNGIIWRKEQDASSDCPGLDCLWCFRFLEDMATHTSSFGVYCINAYTHDVSRVNIVTEQLEPVTMVLPLSVEDMLSIIPNKMVGWMKWRDRDGSILMDIKWKNRESEAGQAIFSGKVVYTSQDSGRKTKSFLKMVIDVETRKVIISESASKEQKDFDTEGYFEGDLQADRVSIVGVWKKSGYDRVADFSIFDEYQ